MVFGGLAHDDSGSSEDLAAALMAALEMVGEAVVVLDTSRCVIHANAAAGAIVGRDALELIGHDAGDVGLLLPDPAAAEDAWTLLARGSAWRGTQLSPPPSGRGPRRPLDVAVTPVFGQHGLPIAYVAVVRDLTEQSAAEVQQRRQAADRAAVLGVMGRVRVAGTVEATSAAMCEAVAAIDGFDGSMILVRPPYGDLVHVANAGPPVPGMEYGTRIPLASLDQLIAITEHGPWYLDMTAPTTPDLIGADLHGAITGAGITATAYGAIHVAGRLIGVLSVASTRPDGARVLADRLGALEQLGALAGSILGGQAVQFARDEATRAAIRDIVAHRRFSTVVQPVVRLADGVPIGCEALSRFHDGRLPMGWFSDAHAVGLGVELEDACAAMAVERVAALPDDWAVGLNLSPQAVLSGSVAKLLDRARHPLVVEITEHSRIDSYGAIRQAMARHPDVAVAVDDAGAGFASLRHILELQPQFVKLDLGLVRDIDRDPARKAMVAGMCHFAAETGARLVAEGVETPEEAATLAALGIELAQGYLWARPMPVDDLLARLRGPGLPLAPAGSG